MPNANNPFGLKPLRDAASGVHNGGLEMFFVPATDPTALYIGDPVIKAGSSDASGVASVMRAGAAGPVTGVVQGFVPDGTTDMAGYRAANTAGYVLVATDPEDLYEIQDPAGTIVAADIGLNAGMTAAAGNAYSKQSGFIIDPATKAAAATLPLKILGLVPRVGNIPGPYQKLAVKINLSTEAHASTGV